MTATRGRLPFTRCLLLGLSLVGGSSLEAQVRSGSYVGNTTGQSIADLGFQPDVVIVKGNAALPAVIRTATMGPGLSKDMVSNVAPLAANILSFDPSGFTVGSGASVNAGGTTYQWVAFKALAGQLKLGTYVGTGADDHSITGIGFQPDYVVVASQNWRPIQRSSAMPGDTSVSFEGTPAPNLIQALQTDGFQVGTNLEVNQLGATIHYAAWKAIAGSMAIGAYTGGTPVDDRSISVGFAPEYVIVKRDTNLGVGAGVHKTASSGLLTDISSRFDAFVNQADTIQALQTDGFQVGGDPRVNNGIAPNVYYWAAFGPHLPKTNYRSIGAAADYFAGTIAVTNGSTGVTGLGTAWLTANRGRGDVITIPCPVAPVCAGGVNYTVTVVSGQAALQIASAYAGISNPLSSYLIRRSHATLQGWEDCVDGPGGAACPFFTVPSNNLAADDRSEVGIVYKDAPYLLAAPLDIDGSITDATRTITLTADGANRHLGLAGTGVVVNNAINTGPALRVRDDHVTVEWLEISGGIGAGADAIETDNQAPANRLTLRFLLVHNAGGKGMDIRDADTVADVYDNVLYQTNGGIALGAGPFTGAIALLNNTLYNCANNGILSAAATNGAVTLRNNIAHSHGLDFVVPAPNPATSHNLSGDPSAPGPSSSPNKPLAQVAFVSTLLGFENLHVGAGSAAIGVGADLSSVFTTDIDGQLRLPAWDLGADETAGGAANLGVTKTDSQTQAVPGTSVTYVITVTNSGPDALTSLFVNDSLPPELIGAAFSPATGAYNSGTGEWTGLNLAASQSVALTLSGTIDPFARGTIVNGVSVSQPAGFTGSGGAASDTDLLDPLADVGISKSDDLDPVTLGGLLTYTLTVTNNGPSGATSVSVQDPLPADMELDAGAGAITPSQGSCNYVVPTRTVSCSLGNLAPGSLATVAIKVHPQALRTFVNTASVSRSEPDPDASDDSEGETTTVQASSIGLRVFTATSTNEKNVLEWINPTDVNYVSTEIVVRGDRFPTGPGDGATIYLSGVGGSGGRVKFPHATGALSNGQTFYYGAFVHRAIAPFLSPGRFVSGRPFDHAPGPVKWAFSTGATALAAPTVGGTGVIATSNDKILYSMERGPNAPGGEWPASFEPIDVGGPVQLRSPVVPVSVGGANPVVFVGSQDGSVYTIDATAGGSVPYLWVTPVGPMLQAAPAGLFGAFGASLDYILVGTRDSSGPNAFVALDPYSGIEVDRWDNGGVGPGEIGIVNGMAVVDQFVSPPRVYFTNYERTPIGSTLTLRCFELSSTPPVFNQIWARALGNIDSSPVLRGGRVYVGSPLGGGTVYSIDALDGNNTLLDRSFVHGNGQVKGFVFPDRASNDIYFATDDFVWGVTDNAGGMINKFASGISLPAGAKPSPVLFVPGSHYVYVGGNDGKLYELDMLGAPGIKSVPLGNGLAVVGAPSLDRIYNLVHVGSEAGIFYAVQIPLP